MREWQILSLLLLIVLCSQVVCRRHRVLQLLRVRIVSRELPRTNLIVVEGESLRFQRMVAILTCFSVQLVCLLGNAFQVSSDRPECAEMSELQILNLPLVLLESNDPVLNVTLAHLCLNILVTYLVHHEHPSAAHWQAYILFLLLLFLQGRLLCQILQLHQPFLVLFVFLLNLVTDEAHVLAGPNDGQLVRI